LFTADGASSIVFHDVIAEFTVSDPSNPVINPATERELFRVEQPFGNHNFGQMRFRPDAESGDADYGLLYLSTGDGGSGNDPLDAGEDLSQILGKVLLIDPLETSGGDPYAVPASNPFIGTAGALPEIYAYGFRNPQSLSWLDDILFSGDIGQNSVEELNIVLAGGNYGWDDREGTFLAGGGALPGNDASNGYQYPFTQYDHEEIASGGEAIFGGFAYQGSDIPGLAGHILFANFPTGEVFVADLSTLTTILSDGLIASNEFVTPEQVTIIGEDGNVTTFADVTGNASGRVDLRFTVTADGEILAFSKQTGNIYQLTSAADDNLAGTGAGESIRAGAGDDNVDSLGGNDTIFGGIGNDTLIGGDGADLIMGGDGDNLLIGDNEMAAASEAPDPVPVVLDLPHTDIAALRLILIEEERSTLSPFDPLADEILLY
ncbi:MAG: PQQ-dependent sugar dehydrogenase, partial [Pseudomonadota bacterium]